MSNTSHTEGNRTTSRASRPFGHSQASPEHGTINFSVQGTRESIRSLSTISRRCVTQPAGHLQYDCTRHCPTACRLDHYPIQSSNHVHTHAFTFRRLQGQIGVPRSNHSLSTSTRLPSKIVTALPELVGVARLLAAWDSPDARASSIIGSTPKLCLAKQ